MVSIHTRVAVGSIHTAAVVSIHTVVVVSIHTRVAVVSTHTVVSIHSSSHCESRVAVVSIHKANVGLVPLSSTADILILIPVAKRGETHFKLVKKSTLR